MKHIAILLLLTIHGWMYTNAQSSDLELVESIGSCGLATNCNNNIVCMDIILTPDYSAEVLSYNVWLKYTNSGLTYVADSACITLDGTDNNLNNLGFYRVSGVLGAEMVQAGVEVTLHTVCFSYDDIEALDTDLITVGGSVFNVLHSPLTFNNPTANEPMLPDFPFAEGEDISCLILPVTWLSFEVQKNTTTADIIWTTAQEFNNAGYEVERSTDGRLFDRIGSVSAAAEAASIHRYTYTDRNPGRGLVYYRIKQIDRDGKFDYSAIRSVSFTGQIAEVKMWPNPVTESLTVTLAESTESGEIKIVNATGGIMLTRQFNVGDEQAEIDMSSVSPGIYNIIVESASHTHQQTIVVLR